MANQPARGARRRRGNGDTPLKTMIVRMRILAEAPPQVWIAISGTLGPATIPRVRQGLHDRIKAGTSIFFPRPAGSTLRLRNRQRRLTHPLRSRPRSALPCHRGPRRNPPLCAHRPPLDPAFPAGLRLAAMGSGLTHNSSTHPDTFATSRLRCGRRQWPTSSPPLSAGSSRHANAPARYALASTPPTSSRSWLPVADPGNPDGAAQANRLLELAIDRFRPQGDPGPARSRRSSRRTSGSHGVEEDVLGLSPIRAWNALTASVQRGRRCRPAGAAPWPAARQPAEADREVVTQHSGLRGPMSCRRRPAAASATR